MKSREKPKRWSRLQLRMTLSYLGVALLNVLLLEFLAILALLIIAPRSAYATNLPRNFLAYLELARGLLISGFIWFIIITPAGVFFGFLVTRGIVRRIHRLVDATSRFANGDYSQQVRVEKKDEIGQLETQFNQMAGQLVESLKKELELREYNVRLEERTRIEQELHTAQLIQRSLLPKEIPELSNWKIATYYQPAREVGGDLYDFLVLADGKLGLIIGDVADKGIPAAMVMASTRSMIRAAAQVIESPGLVLAHVNNLLYDDTPEKMFVTCFYAILDLHKGTLRFANAGHDLPYRRQYETITELRATGLPLGLLPEMFYEEFEVTLAPGESVLFYSDGLVEAHNARREMFGFPRLKTLLQTQTEGIPVIDGLLGALKIFTGENWEQEDDVTMVLLQRTLEHV